MGNYFAVPVETTKPGLSEREVEEAFEYFMEMQQDEIRASLTRCEADLSKLEKNMDGNEAEQDEMIREITATSRTLKALSGINVCIVEIPFPISFRNATKELEGLAVPRDLEEREERISARTKALDKRVKYYRAMADALDRTREKIDETASIANKAIALVGSSGYL